jgi:hypothetical protein
MKEGRLVPRILVAVVLSFGVAWSAWAVPSITIDPLCSYGAAACNISGRVSGVNLSDYDVAPYIKVDEVWWTKPYLNPPTCPINPSNGTYSCSITTGGCDRYATAAKVYLIRKSSEPTRCFPCLAPPTNPSVATATQNRPYPRTISFSGYKWRVKKAPECRLGPGPNFFSDASSDVWVDGRGLHLRIKKLLNYWYSTEVILDKSLGYGTYIFLTNSRVDNIDPTAVLGLFTWDSAVYHPTHREMDIEFSRWGNAGDPKNAQFIVQDSSGLCGATNCSRFAVPSKLLTLYIVWSPGKADFRVYRGHYVGTPPSTSLIHRWVKTGASVPVPGKENIRFNFWLFGGRPPSNGVGGEVIMERFLFRPPA